MAGEKMELRLDSRARIADFYNLESEKASLAGEALRTRTNSFRGC
jgi:hypothetical protein